MNPISPLLMPYDVRPLEETVVVRLGEAEKSINKVQLLAISDYFKSQLNFRVQGQIKLCSLEDIPHETCVDFLEYLATGRIHLTQDNCTWVLLLAREQMISSLIEECKKFIVWNLVDIEVDEYLIFAKEFQFPDLLGACIQFVRNRNILDEENLMYYLDFAALHDLQMLNIICVENVRYSNNVQLANKVIDFVTQRNDKNLNLLCFKDLIPKYQPKSHPFFELWKKLSNALVSFNITDKGGRTVCLDTRDLSEVECQVLREIYDTLSIESLEVERLRDDALELLASFIPSPLTVLFNREQNKDIPELWLRNVKKFVLTFTDIKIINCLQAEILKCTACNELMNVNAPEARRIEMTRCSVLKTLHLPKAEWLKVDRCYQLESVTIPEDCIVLGLPSKCQIVTV